MSMFVGTDGADSASEYDYLRGQGGDDDLWLGGAEEGAGGFAYGGDGNDVVTGSYGDDVLFGGRGDDLIFGTAGRDILKGGKGADTFRFTFANLPGIDGPSVDGGRDLVLDFNPRKDSIHIESMGFADPVAFYRPHSGKVFVDFDGAGELVPLHFASVAAGLKVTADDFAFY